MFTLQTSEVKQVEEIDPDIQFEMNLEMRECPLHEAWKRAFLRAGGCRGALGHTAFVNAVQSGMRFHISEAEVEELWQGWASRNPGKLMGLKRFLKVCEKRL